MLTACVHVQTHKQVRNIGLKAVRAILYMYPKAQQNEYENCLNNEDPTLSETADHAFKALQV
jgi:hypothetical protein